MTEPVKPREWTLNGGNRHINRSSRAQVRDDGDGPFLAPGELMVRVLEAEPVEQELQALRQTLEDLAEQHHRTVGYSSSIHDPGRIETFRDCQARACRTAAEVLQ